MKVSKLAFLILGVTLLSLASAEPTGGKGRMRKPEVSCFLNLYGLTKFAPSSRRYSGRTTNLPDDANIGEICNRFWKGLQQFGVHCAAWSHAAYPHYCGKDRGRDGELAWQFESAIGCNRGMVSAAWWEATHNKYGSLDKCLRTRTKSIIPHPYPV